MARSTGEFTNPLHCGPSDCTILSTCLTLDWGWTTGFPEECRFTPLAANLVSFLPDPTAVRRMQALASTIAQGRAKVTSVSHKHWAEVIDTAMNPFVGDPISVVIVIPRSRRNLMDHPPASLDLPHACPVVVVTDDAGLFRDPVRDFIDGIVYSEQDRLMDTAVAVYKILLGDIAPQTNTCLDVEDILRVLKEGPQAQICNALWTPYGELIFASPRDKGILECATAALVQIPSDDSQLPLSEMSAIFNLVRKHAHSEAWVVMNSPVAMFIQSWSLGGFLPLQILCNRPA